MSTRTTWSVIYCVGDRYKRKERELEKVTTTARHITYRRTNMKEGVAETIRLPKNQIIEQWKE